ncbi:hypothetical protein HSX11_02650 [Oxalobacteraceae bacterium]|nr:hypothetical protein [Oxalobacteraceae bacterium]
MIDIFQPLSYKIPQPAPDEISIILNSSIQEYIIDEISCSQYIDIAEGFFRFKKINKSTEHNDHTFQKISTIYEIVKNFNPDDIIIRVDYLLNSGLKVGIYIKKDSGLVIGSIRGYRTDRITKQEYQKLWYGTSEGPTS